MKAKKRLLGTWRSDRRRTMKDWIWTKKYTPKQRKFPTNLFGQLTVRWTRAKIYTERKGFRRSSSYEIIGADVDSVALMAYNQLTKQQTIRHVHFEGDNYWVLIGGSGRNREWFKKIK